MTALNRTYRRTNVAVGMEKNVAMLAIMEPIHKRMPVILGQDEEEAWLDPATNVDATREMCKSCPSMLPARQFGADCR